MWGYEVGHIKVEWLDCIRQEPGVGPMGLTLVIVWEGKPSL